jgi:hypothetical protein
MSKRLRMLQYDKHDNQSVQSTKIRAGGVNDVRLFPKTPYFPAELVRQQDDLGSPGNFGVAVNGIENYSLCVGEEERRKTVRDGRNSDRTPLWTMERPLPDLFLTLRAFFSKLRFPA